MLFDIKIYEHWIDNPGNETGSIKTIKLFTDPWDNRGYYAYSLFTELVNFILVYRLPEYKKNVADIEKENEALELLQNKLSSASLTQRDKVKKSINRTKEKLKGYNQKMFGIRFKSTLVMILPTVAVFAVLSKAIPGSRR